MFGEVCAPIVVTHHAATLTGALSGAMARIANVVEVLSSGRRSAVTRNRTYRVSRPPGTHCWRTSKVLTYWKVN